MKQKYYFLILLLILLLPYFLISIYANPSGDDFTYSSRTRDFGFLTSYIYDYLHWNGRYTSNVFVLINPLIFSSFYAYKLIPIFIISLTIFAIFIFLKSLIGKNFSKIELINFSLIISLLFLYQMPIISEGIYWYTGAVTYQLGIIFVMYYLNFLINFYNQKFIFNSKFIHISLITILLFLSVGFNEIIMILTFCFSLVLLFISHKNKFLNNSFTIYLAIISFVFSLLVYFAPGNSTREGLFNNNHNIIYSLAFSVAQTLRFFTYWISSSALLLLSILYFYVNKQLSKSNNLFKNSFYFNPFYSSIVLFFVIFISIFPAYWATGILGQHRTLNIAYFFFIIVWFLNLTVWFNFYADKLNINSNINYKIKIVFVLIILATFQFSKNGFDLISDIAYNKAQHFDIQMNERYSIMKNSNDTIFLKTIINPPKTLLIYDITKNSNDWQNLCYSIYFKCEEKPVVLKN